jgi:ribosomal protein L3
VVAPTLSRVFKGLRMAGRTGGNKVTTENLKVVKMDKDKNLLLLRVGSWSQRQHRDHLEVRWNSRSTARTASPPARKPS